MKQLDLERTIIETSPESKREVLINIYLNKGLSMEQASIVTGEILTSPSIALDTVVREELGLNPSQLGSPWSAAFSSFAAFVTGALIPIIPYLVRGNVEVVLQSVSLSAASLLLVGGTISWMSSKNIIWGAARMACLGGLAALVTFLLGTIVGSSLLM